MLLYATKKKGTKMKTKFNTTENPNNIQIDIDVAENVINSIEDNLESVYYTCSNQKQSEQVAESLKYLQGLKKIFQKADDKLKLFYSEKEKDGEIYPN